MIKQKIFKTKKIKDIIQDHQNKINKWFGYSNIQFIGANDYQDQEFWYSVIYYNKK